MNYETASNLVKILGPICRQAIGEPLSTSGGAVADIHPLQLGVKIWQPLPDAESTVLCKAKIRNGSGEERCFLLYARGKCPQKFTRQVLPMDEIEPLLK